jgi:hypothetical protein
MTSYRNILHDLMYLIVSHLGVKPSYIKLTLFFQKCIYQIKGKLLYFRIGFVDVARKYWHQLCDCVIECIGQMWNGTFLVLYMHVRCFHVYSVTFL